MGQHTPNRPLAAKIVRALDKHGAFAGPRDPRTTSTGLEYENASEDKELVSELVQAHLEPAPMEVHGDRTTISCGEYELAQDMQDKIYGMTIMLTDDVPRDFLTLPEARKLRDWLNAVIPTHEEWEEGIRDGLRQD